jgi:hypothetical protein
MSRQKHEFKIRTSIFEGAFRAWSFMGQIHPDTLQNMRMEDIDPVYFSDSNKHKCPDDEGISRPKYPYEPLPTNGAHPFIKAILLAHLGSTDVVRSSGKEALSSLRNWWQHRRKGENKTCVKLLRTTNDMRSIVDQYTRSFFQLAYQFVMSGKAQPPQTLCLNIQKMGKSIQDSCLQNIMTSPNHSCTRNKIRTQNRNKMRQVKKRTSTMEPDLSGAAVTDRKDSDIACPMIFESSNGDLQILLHVTLLDGPRCYKILEIALKGCQGKASPIQGLQDAVVCGPDLSRILLKIDHRNNAPRIAEEACRNLHLLGHSAQPNEWNVSSTTADDASTIGNRCAYATAKSHPPLYYFDWHIPCTCPEYSEVWASHCVRHWNANHPSLYEKFLVCEDKILQDDRISPRNVRDVDDDDDASLRVCVDSSRHDEGRTMTCTPVDPSMPSSLLPHQKPIWNSFREKSLEFPEPTTTPPACGFSFLQVRESSLSQLMPRMMMMHHRTERDISHQGSSRPPSRPQFQDDLCNQDDDDDVYSLWKGVDDVDSMGHPWDEPLL